MRHFFLLLALLLALLPLRAQEDAKTVTITGSAFVINPDGYLLTCDHLVYLADSVKVTLGDTTYEASVLDTDDTPSANLIDTAGKARGRFLLNTGGFAGVLLSDKSGNPRLELSVAQNGPPFNLFDANGKVFWTTPQKSSH